MSSSSSLMSSITDPRAQRWGNVAKHGFFGLAVIFGLALLAPVLWAAMGGLIALLGLIGLTVGAWTLRPWVFMKAANLRLALIKREAAKNPVETLQEEHRKQSQILEDRKRGIEDMAGAIRTLDQTIDKLESEFPDSPELPQMRQDQAELEALLKARRADWQEAYISLGEFAKEIQRVARLWEVSLAAARARKQSGLTEEEWMSKLKTQTSIDAIRTNLNTQLSALNTENMQAEADRILKGRAAQRAKPAAALPAPDSARVIELPPSSVKATVAAR